MNSVLKEDWCTCNARPYKKNATYLYTLTVIRLVFGMIKLEDVTRWIVEKTVWLVSLATHAIREPFKGNHFLSLVDAASKF